jgi:Zn-dependent protease with chaperone function
MFVGLYALTFVPVALLVLGLVPLVLGNAVGSVLVDPLGFAVIFLPLAIVPTLTILATRYFGLRREVAEAPSIREVTPRQEPRPVRIGEEQAILQGLARPQFGVIETTARNALSVGATPSQRMIAVTRGLMDVLDDDEIAAVIAHELAHFRAGDAAFLSLNYALFQTAAWLQTYNPLKIDKDVHHKVQWHLVMMIALPIFLVAFGLGGIMTSLAWRLTRLADSRVRATRDFVADAEALRITHFPEALQSAITKCEGEGYFKGAERFEALLFSGNPVGQGGSHSLCARAARCNGRGGSRAVHARPHAPRHAHGHGAGHDGASGRSGRVRAARAATRLCPCQCERQCRSGHRCQWRCGGQRLCTC